MTYPQSAHEDIEQLPISALLQNFREAVARNCYVEATGSRRPRAARASTVGKSTRTIAESHTACEVDRLAGHFRLERLIA